MTVHGQRVAASVACALVVMVVVAPPADAHTLTGVAATNYDSRLVTVTPATASLDVRILDLGRQIEVRNDTGTTITVLGYYDEPYLQVGPTGTFENTNAPSTYTNRTPTEVPPAGIVATSPPQWHRINDSHVAKWPDQRIRWEGQDPLVVRQAPGTQHVVRNWQLTLRVGDTTAAPAIFVLGTITWIPPPTSAPWFAAIGVVAVVVLLGMRSRRSAAWLAAAVAAIVAVDTVNALAGVAFSTSGALSIFSALVTHDPLTSFAWLSGIGALIAVRRGERRAVLFAGLTGWILTITSGLADSSVFSRSVIPTKLDPDLTRAYTTLTIGLGVAMAIAGVLAVLEDRRQSRQAAKRPVTAHHP